MCEHRLLDNKFIEDLAQKLIDLKFTTAQIDSVKSMDVKIIQISTGEVYNRFVLKILPPLENELATEQKLSLHAS